MGFWKAEGGEAMLINEIKNAQPGQRISNSSKAEVDHKPEASSLIQSNSALKQAKQALEGRNCRWT